MKLYKIILVCLLFLGIGTSAQDTTVVRTFDLIPENEIQVDKFGNKYYYDKVAKAKYYKINGETVVIMDELILRRKPKFNTTLDEKYYRFLNRKISNVYPLFLIALEQYNDIEEEVAKLDKKSDKRKHAKKKYKELSAKYEKILRNLTTTEGRVFAKLMNRATGKTVYDITKDLKGGWSAFWWNVKGKLASVDIKTPYNPRKDRTDYFLEHLLRTNWQSNSLPPYPGYKNFKIKKPQMKE